LYFKETRLKLDYRKKFSGKRVAGFTYYPSMAT
jgi:hypothetical protein